MRLLYDIRIEKRIGLRDFCKRIAIDVGRYSQIERGISPPSAAERQLISEHLGEPFDLPSSVEYVSGPVFSCREDGCQIEWFDEEEFLKKGIEQEKLEAKNKPDAPLNSGQLYDIFIGQYSSPLSEDQKNRIGQIQVAAFKFAQEILKAISPGRESENAVSAIEDAVFSAVKSIQMEKSRR